MTGRRALLFAAAAADLVASTISAPLTAFATEDAARFVLDLSSNCPLCNSFSPLLFSTTNEAASNSLVHGYRENEEGTLRLAASLAGNTLAITLSDDGVGDQAGTREGDEVGRGFPLMRALADSVDVSRGERGTRVRLTFPL